MLQRIKASFDYDQSMNMFVSRTDRDRVIRPGTEVRYKIEQIKYDKGVFTTIGSIDGDYLGPTSLGSTSN